jgi:hypothetical protein
MNALVAILRSRGVTTAQGLSGIEVDQIRQYLSNFPVYDAHVKAKSKESSSLADAFNNPDWPMFTHDMEVAVLAPFFFERALLTYPLAKEYFDGEQPYLYSMNAFWTKPCTTRTYGDTHGWHRDGDGRKQLVLFMFGTSVPSVEDGGHCYQINTQNKEDSAVGYNWCDPPQEVVHTVAGEAGTCFLADTRGLHMGQRPARAPRLLMWARWGVDDPPVSYGWDELSPVAKERLGTRYPTDPELQKAIHLIAS